MKSSYASSFVCAEGFWLDFADDRGADNTAAKETQRFVIH